MTMSEKQLSPQMDLFDAIQQTAEPLGQTEPVAPEAIPFTQAFIPQEPPIYPDSERSPIETVTLQKVVSNLSKFRRSGGFLKATDKDSMHRRAIERRYKSSQKVDSLRRTDEELGQIFDEARADFRFFVRIGNYALAGSVVVDESIAETHTEEMFDRFYDRYYGQGGTRRRRMLSRALKNEPKPEDVQPNTFRNARKALYSRD